MDFIAPVVALERNAQCYGPTPMLHQPQGDGSYTVYSYQQAFFMVCRLAQGLLSQGLKRGDRVGILSKNCAEWFLLDWAIQMAGLISVPLYPTAQCSAVEAQIEKVPIQLLVLGKLDNAEHYLPLTQLGIATLALPYWHFQCSISWSSLSESPELAVEQRFHATENDVMTIHFSSGTNGEPKGAELTYGAYFYACHHATTAMQVTQDDRLLSYLPLAHIAERMMIQGNGLYSGAQVYFVHSLESFVTDLNAAQPTAFMSVPRLWKNFQTAIHSKIPPPILNTLLRLPLLNTVIKRVVRNKLGLKHTRIPGSGAAAMPLDLLRWYHRLDIPISEAWGMTETCGLSTMNYPFRAERMGTVGEPLPGTELKVDEHGEVWIRSTAVFRGYVNDEVATAASFDADGYFRTGDKATWDDNVQGWRLQGRINESFKTAKGEFVHPQMIESQLLQFPDIEHACVMGEGAAQPLAVVQLATDALASVADSEHLEGIRKALNRGLAKHEQLSAIHSSDVIWSVENQLLTPTLKMRRQAVMRRFSDLMP